MGGGGDAKEIEEKKQGNLYSNFNDSHTLTEQSVVVAGEKGFLRYGVDKWEENEEGCVVSSKTAWKLFGSTDVVGQWIMVKGKRFIIRGVTADSNAVVILPAGREKPDFFQNVSFSYDEGGAMWGGRNL